MNWLFSLSDLTEYSRIIGTEICVDATENGIPMTCTVGDTVADGSPDAVDSDGEDSEIDENMEIFYLARLDALTMKTRKMK